MAQFVKVAKTSEIAPGAAKLVEIGEVMIALFNIKGKFYGLDNSCPHKEGPLASGGISDDEVTCPLHESKFHIPTGRVLGPPAISDVKTYNVRVVGEDIEAEL